MNERKWAHELGVGVAAALNLFDPPEDVDEALLARVLRGIAVNSDELGDALFLRAMADALDNPAAKRRLTLNNARAGRPPDTTGKFERALLIGGRVESLVGAGWKKEAAIQQVMSDLSLSRSAILRSCSEYRNWRPLMDDVQVSINSQRKRKSVK